MYTLGISIHYTCTPWTKVSFWGDRVQCDDYTPADYDRNVLIENPRFWKAVRQLSFAFQRQEKLKIRDFYDQYGPILATQFDNEESYSEVAIKLEWFRHLTLMTEWIKDGKTRLLTELLPTEQKFTQPFMAFFGGPDPSAPIDPAYDEPDGIPVWPSIWSTPFGDPTREQPFFRGPNNEEELYSAAWEAVVRSLWAYFRRNSPAAKRPWRDVMLQPSIMPGIWSANVSSALSAAVYQWYFEELAEDLSASSGTSCSAEGCGRLVPPQRLKHTAPDRRAFCSARCRERQKKRDQRSAKLWP